MATENKCDLCGKKKCSKQLGFLEIEVSFDKVTYDADDDPIVENYTEKCHYCCEDCLKKALEHLKGLSKYWDTE